MIACLVGGQYGSEGKGLIAGHLANEFQAHVRVGAANAGHTVYTFDGSDWTKHVVQQIPCAAYANPFAVCFLGPGAQISPDILAREVRDNRAWREERGHPDLELVVDYRAHVIQRNHVEREAASDLAERIGSTSTIAREGIGAAQAARVMRDDSCVQARRSPELCGIAETGDVVRELGYIEHAFLEGTQGYGLSLTTGDFPYVTSRNTTSAGLAADSGVAPNRIGRVILVCRTYPIRVAGNSGPFARGSEEIIWDDLDVDPESERTTVTKKIRRVATFSMPQVVEAAKVNGATEIALTFCDYLDPKCAGAQGEMYEPGPGPVKDLVDAIEYETGVLVRWLGTGPHHVVHLRDPR